MLKIKSELINRHDPKEGRILTFEFSDEATKKCYEEVHEVILRHLQRGTHK